ncbi:helix-turn-helix domain-containing protein [Vibrio nigripulchritudo]
MLLLKVNFKSITMLDIGTVAKQSGLNSSALRYYESIGLIHSAGRKGLRRQYPKEVLQKLALINLGRKAGLSLDEIRGMFDESGDLNIDRQALLNKVDDIERSIRQLICIKDSLLHVANCPAKDHLQCPSFQKMLNEL